MPFFRKKVDISEFIYGFIKIIYDSQLFNSDSIDIIGKISKKDKDLVLNEILFYQLSLSFVILLNMYKLDEKYSPENKKIVKKPEEFGFRFTIMLGKILKKQEKNVNYIKQFIDGFEKAGKDYTSKLVNKQIDENVLHKVFLETFRKRVLKILSKNKKDIQEDNINYIFNTVLHQLNLDFQDYSERVKLI